MAFTSSDIYIITRAVCEVILVPPEAPETILTLCLFLSTIITGHVEDMGLFPGLMKFCGDGGTPKELVTLGELKSSIWLLNMIPVFGDIFTLPKLEKKVLINLQLVLR